MATHSNIGGRDFAGDVTIRGTLACNDIQDRSANPFVASPGTDVTWISKAGVPGSSDGATVAGPGSICSDITNFDLYINAGTKATPSWKLVTRAA
jgi:hypothetical protein